MFTFSNRRGYAAAGCAAIALSVLMLLPATGSAQSASGDWTCKAVGLKIGNFEVGVANKAYRPCRTNIAFPVALSRTVGSVVVNVAAVGGSTNARKNFGRRGDGVAAQAGVVGLALQALGIPMQIAGARSLGFVTCAVDQTSPTGLSPAYNGPDKNETGAIWVNNPNNEFEAEGPFVLDLGVLKISLNTREVGVLQNGGFMRLRPLQIESPLLPTIIAGQSTVGFAGNPCDGTRP